MGNTEPTGRDLVPGFAAAVASAREAKGMSRRELADAAGVSFNSIYSIESEKRAPSLRVAMVIADALGVSLVDLLPPAEAKEVAGHSQVADADRPVGKQK